MKLNLYLFQSGVGRFDQCVRPEDSKRQYQDITNTESEKVQQNFQILVIRKEASQPSWARFFAGYAQGGAADAIISQSPSALILFKVQTEDGPRFMAATMGTAYSALEKGLLEKDFGLKVTLGSVAPGRLKTVQYADLQAGGAQRSESVESPSSLAQFGYDFNSELVKSVSGRAVSPELGNTIAGADSLKISIADMKIEQMTVVAEEAYRRFKHGSYKENFSFIDDIREIGSDLDVAMLQSELLTALASGGAAWDRIRLLQVRPGFFDDVDHILLSVKGERERVDMLDVNSVLSRIKQDAPELDIESLKADVFVVGCDSGENVITKKLSLYKLFSFMVHHEHLGLCVLRAGKWYRVSEGVIKNAERKIDSVTEESKTPPKSWSLDTAERHIGSELPKGWEDATTSFVQAAGYGRFAPADAVNTVDGVLGYAKKSNSELSMSTVIERARAAVELVRDGNASMKAYLDEAGISNKEDGQIKVALMIGAKRSVNEDLSVFDRLTLARGIKELSRLGVKVSVHQIPLA